MLLKLISLSRRRPWTSIGRHLFLFLLAQEECIAAGIESKEVRGCELKPCSKRLQEKAAKAEKFGKFKKFGKKKPEPEPEPEVDPIEVEIEVITKSEVESVKSKILKKERQLNETLHRTLDRLVGKEPVPTAAPKPETEEQTNSIQLIPNYWIPIKQFGFHGNVENSFNH